MRMCVCVKKNVSFRERKRGNNADMRKHNTLVITQKLILEMILYFLFQICIF